ELPQKWLDAEVRERAAEERGRELAREHGRFVERMPGFVEQADVLHEAMMRFLAEEIAERRVLERADVDFGATGSVIFRTFEEGDLLAVTYVHADERTVAVDRPRDRMTRDAQICLDIADQLERVFPDAVALVDEREDRRPPSLTDVEELPRPIL